MYDERSSFISAWREANDFVSPRRARFFVTDTNKGDRRTNDIIDNTATRALRTLSSGMMSGITSPARRWFRLATPDPDLNEFDPVKEWLYYVSNRMSDIFLRSNLYNSLKIGYKDIALFATAATLLEEDMDETILTYSMPVGSYYIANDARNRVRVFGRDYQMTVRQLIEKFGKYDDRTGKPNWEVFSNFVRSEYDRSNYETWIDIRHFITPNREYDPNKIDPKFKEFSSCYYEAGNTGKGRTNYITSMDESKYLRESGYDYFPVLAPRWEVTGEDVYGTSCPTFEAMGDIKALQLMQRRKYEAIEKMVRPPMTGPSSLKNQKVSILPADVTYQDLRADQQGLRPIFQVDPRIQELLLDIQDHQRRISSTYYEDLFLMLAQSDRRQITAREIDERHEEKLLALGPVLEQLNQDLLDPLIENTFSIMLKRGMVPDAPEELQGMDLKVEYESMMAEAQKLVGIASVERFTGFASQVLQVAPESVDKIDVNQLLDVYGDITSLPPGIVRSDEKVDQIRQQRAQAIQAQQRMEQISSMAGAAKDLSQADTEGDNALTRIIDQANAGSIVPTR